MMTVIIIIIIHIELKRLSNSTGLGTRLKKKFNNSNQSDNSFRLYYVLSEFFSFTVVENWNDQYISEGMPLNERLSLIPIKIRPWMLASNDLIILSSVIYGQGSFQWKSIVNVLLLMMSFVSKMVVFCIKVVAVETPTNQLAVSFSVTCPDY